MPFSHAVVWLDHRRDELMQFDAEQAEERNLRALRAVHVAYTQLEASPTRILGSRLHDAAPSACSSCQEAGPSRWACRCEGICACSARNCLSSSAMRLI